MGSSAIPPTQDPDFMKAAPHDQMAYLTATDPDFAKASPQDQLGYLMHVRGLSPTLSAPASGYATAPVQLRAVDIAGNPQNEAAATSGLPGGSSSPAAATKGMIAAGALGVGAAATAVQGPALLAGARQFATQHPIIAQLMASAGISEARKIPYLGKLIPSGAELAPLVLGMGKGGTAEPEVAPETTPIEPGAPVTSGKVALPQGPAYGPGRINPPMEAAQSSTVDLHGYDPATRTLKVQFKNGKVYELNGVPQEIYNNYRNAESQGSFYQQQLKGRYDTQYVGSVGKKR